MSPLRKDTNQKDLFGSEELKQQLTLANKVGFHLMFKSSYHHTNIRTVRCLTPTKMCLSVDITARKAYFRQDFLDFCL